MTRSVGVLVHRLRISISRYELRFQRAIRREGRLFAPCHITKRTGNSVTKDLSSEERYILSHLSRNALAKLTAEDQSACRRLEAGGLLTKVVHGSWALTASEKFLASGGR